LLHVFGADFRCAEEAEEWSAFCRGLDGRAAIGFLAFDDADYCGDDHSGLAGGFDGVDGGGASGAYVVDDDDASALAAETFNAAGSAMLFFRFADEEAVELRRGWVGVRTPGAGRGHVGDDGIGAQGEAADGLGFYPLFIEKIEDGLAGEPAAFSVECGCAAVDIVVAGAAGRELELAEAEAGAG